MATVDLSEPLRPRRIGRAFAAWTVAVVVYSLVLKIQIGLPFGVALRQSAVYLYSLAILSIPATLWARRSLVSERPSVIVVSSHIAAGILTVAAWFGVNVLSDRLALGPDFWLIIYANNWLFQLIFAVTTYGSVIGIALATEGWRRQREREQREAALMIQTRDAELTAIRAQFQPHFVLNALNSLLALIDADPALARTMVVRLADVMKEVFGREDQPVVPLDRELELVRAYLDVERIRFGPRLAVSIDVDAEARRVPVPAFLLQPIVENAVKHGIAPYVQPGTVGIRARVERGRLTITVTDSGTGRSDGADGSGLGLSITRRRLDTLYGDKATLVLDRGSTGATARLELPAEGADGR